MQSFAGKNIAGIVENMIHDVGSGLHNHIAFFQRGGAVGMRKAKSAKGKKQLKKRQAKKIRRISDRFMKYPSRDKIAALEPIIDRLNETIELDERMFGTDWSAGGSDLDPVDWAGDKPPAGTERFKLIAHYEQLLALYRERRDLILTAVAWLENLIGRYRAQIKAIETKKTQTYNGEKIKPEPKWQLKGFRSGLENARGALGDLNEAKVDIQGLTGQGGAISDTMLRLTELGYRPPAEAPEPGEAPGETGTESEIADLLRQQLAESQRALAITQAQMPIFQQFMPRFHQGGIVQGPMGAERPVMAQAGEGIFTREQMRAMGSQNITVVIEDAAIDSNRIRVEVDGVIQEKVSTVRRQGSNRRFATK